MKIQISCFVLAVLLVFTCTGCGERSTGDITSPAASAQHEGESLSTALGVPERIQGEFASESGISRVTVDAQVIVPDVPRVDVVAAIPRTFTDDEMRGFIARYDDGLDWRYAQTDQPYTGDLPEIERNTGGVDVYSLFIDIPVVDGADYRYITASYGLHSKTGALGWMQRLDYIKSPFLLDTDYLLPLTNGKAQGCSISLEKAIGYADEEVKALAPDYALTQYGQIPVWETVGNPQFYSFRYTRHIGGIPVSDCYGGESMNNDFDYTAGLGVITVIVRDDGVCYIEYSNPYDVGGIVEENIELLPFDAIWDIFQKIGLLSIQHLEVYEDLQKNNMEVYEIRLGYMSVRQADGGYLYLPVWDFYAKRVFGGTGGYANALQIDPVQGWSHLTINAIDGTIIDRDLGY